jgi:mRNA-degrading endonuclease RelE of RelBE toxin-antitoxin system
MDHRKSHVDSFGVADYNPISGSVFLRGILVSLRVEFTEDAFLDLKHLRRHEQRTILAAIEKQLEVAPMKPTRNRKPLRPNDLSTWEVRVGKYRVFYDVVEEGKRVVIKAVGWKEHNRLFIRGEEFQL